MRIKNQTFKLLSLIISLTIMSACSTETSPIPDNDDPVDNERPLSKLELVVKHWSIDTAYHAGVKDVSSTGKTIEFFNGGSYDFNGDFSGTWRFNTDSSELIIDEGQSYQQDWEITHLGEQRFVADFKSPFTGQPSTWIMH
jgi:hypothetical protein